MFTKAVMLFLFPYFLHAVESYVIPAAEIIVFQPRGFSVSIPDSPGIRLFAFHGNFNQQISKREPGQFSQEVLRAVNNKWTVYDHSTKLKAGDTISYWLFILKDHMGYMQSDLTFTVKESIFNPNFQHSSKNNSPYGSNINDIENKVDNEKDNTLCLQTIFNITQSFVDLQTKNDELTSKNMFLKELIEKMPNSRQLTLSGRIPPNGSPVNTVAFILSEKLNINLSITSAERNADGSITFEVPSIDDKLQIISAAKDGLLLTKISIK